MMLGQKLCPMCARYTDQADELCPHCGYNFTTGEPDEQAEIAVLSEGEEEVSDDSERASPPVPEIPAPERTRAGIRTLVALLVILGLAVPILVTLPIREAIRSVEGSPLEERRRRPDHAAVRSCAGSVSSYIDELLAPRPQREDSVQALLLDAADELGVTSYEYATLLRVYGEGRLPSIAAKKGTRKAMKRAEVLILKECRRGYR